ncbi:prenyltransferase [Marinobacteraceae bacterium S3BR75-40.1]
MVSPDSSPAYSRPQGVFPALLGVAREPFLVLTPGCVLLGVAVAAQHTVSFDALRVVLVFLAALSAHIAVNVLNELSDFRSGLDLKTERTPFSGGSGTLPGQPRHFRNAKRLAAGALLVLGICGLWLVWLSGPALLLFGVLGLVIVLTYTDWLNRNPWLCLLAPGIGFGPCMVAATELALSGEVSLSGWVASLVAGCLTSGLLLLNQFPDREADREARRRHLLIVYGVTQARYVYLGLIAVAVMPVVTMVVTGVWPGWTLLALAPFLLVFIIEPPLRRSPDNIEALIPALGANVLLVNLVIWLLVLGVYLG